VREVRSPTRLAWLGLVLALLGIALAGCSGDDGTDPAREALERELRTDDTLTVCADPTRPPSAYRAADGVLRGFEVDLLGEVAARLELGQAWIDVPRDETVDAVVAGRCDAAVSTLAIRRDRGSLGRMAAIGYLGVPVSLLVRRGARSLGTTGLCGRRVGVLSGSLEQDLLEEHARTCAGRGGRLEVAPHTSTPEAHAELRSGGLDAILDEHPVNAWFARRQTDRFDLAWVLGEEIVRWAIGVGIEKPELYHRIRAALRELGHDGTFDSLLDTWGLDRAGVVRLPTT